VYLLFLLYNTQFKASVYESNSFKLIIVATIQRKLNKSGVCNNSE